MKRISVRTLLIICLILAHQGLSSRPLFHFSQSAALAAGRNENACGDPTFLVEGQSEVSAKLTIIEAGCDGAYTWKAQLELRNTSNKVIRGYEVAHIEPYQHKMRSSFIVLRRSPSSRMLSCY